MTTTNILVYPDTIIGINEHEYLDAREFMCKQIGDLVTKSVEGPIIECIRTFSTEEKEILIRRMDTEYTDYHILFVECDSEMNYIDFLGTVIPFKYEETV